MIVARGSFTRWLRSNSEHYLLVDAQERMAAKYGRARPTPPQGARELFWRRLFTPVYRRLPWKMRWSLIQRMPGSHRRSWAPRQTAPRQPAV